MSVILCSSCEEQLRREMYKRIEAQLSDIRQGKSSAERVILVVPAQSTLQTEEEGFRYLGGKGFIDFAVMSGARLRSYVLSETGSPDKTAVNTIGRKMLLRRIASKRRPELSSFGSVCERPGFLDLAGDMIVQLKQNEIDPTDLACIAEMKTLTPILAEKLSDMQLIYADYEMFMAGKYTDSEDLLKYTESKLKESEYIKSSIIWYYDFYSFTKREYSFLKELSSCAAEFNAAMLAGDKRYVCGERTAARLSSELGIKRQVLRDEEEKEHDIRVIKCASPYSQSRTIAADILSKVRDENISYKDVIVLTQDMEGMGENLKRVFTSFGIPVFIDEKRSMQHSAAAGIVSSSLDAAVSGFKRQHVLAFLKSGILGTKPDDISLFENYVRQYKVFDKAFLKPFKYGRDKLGQERFETVESIRASIEKTLLPFKEDLDKASTAEEKTRVLYDFLTEGISLPSYLESRGKELEEDGFLDASQELSQSFAVIVDIMDQIVELFGDEEINGSDYANMLTSCFEDIKVGVLPQAEGKVRIGTVTRSSFSDVHTLYIAGFNDGMIPSDPAGENILTDSEIEFLADAGIMASKTSDTLSLEEEYQIERALNTDTKETVICCSLSDLDGNAMRPSPLLSDLPVSRFKLKEEKDLDEDKELLGYIQNKETVFAKMPQLIKTLSRGEDIPEAWKAAYDIVKDDPKSRVLSEAVFFAPVGGKIAPEVSNELFKRGGDDHYSPTQLEVYSSCPFKHFVSRGLAPEELDVFDVGSREAGNIYHLVLLQLSQMLTDGCKEKGIDMTDPMSPWMTITEDEVSSLIEEILEKNKDVFMDGVMSFDESSEYRVSRIKSVCMVFAKYMIEQVRKGKISAMYFETPFGSGKTFPAVRVPTPFGDAIIEGQIDRVDILGSGDGRYVKIIDYKSGDKSFDRKKVEEGIDLQLMIYLEGVLGSDNALMPGGVFYYAVKDHEKERDYSVVIADEISKDISEKIAKEFALDGIVVKEPAVLTAMDTEIVSGDTTKTSVFNDRHRARTEEGKALISKEDMEKLRIDFKNALTKICEGLRSGDISIDPKYYKNENIGCKYCSFSAVCLRDLKYGV